jgi:succinate dehydrogenase cytochrome b556 subunit
MFVWIVHRVTGILLFVMISIHILAGHVLAGKYQNIFTDAFAKFHKDPLYNSIILFMFIFHSLYGIRTMIVDLGFRKERALFWSFNIVGLVVFGLASFYFYQRPM